MIENALAWGCLLVWILSGNPQYVIAASGFAIATQIYSMRKGGGSDA